MDRFYGKGLRRAGCTFLIPIFFFVFCWAQSVSAITYEPIEPETLLKNAQEHVGEFITFQAKFSHLIYSKTEELLSSTTGVKVNLKTYDSFGVYGKGLFVPRLLMYKKRGSILYELKRDTPITIYGEIFSVNLVGEPIILVHKIEKVDSNTENVDK